MNDICMFCFHVKGQYEVCPYCGHVEGTPPLQPYHLPEGTVLADHFLVGPVIGEGNSGITYRCYDQNLGMMVAIKEFFPYGMVTRAPGQIEVGVVSPRDAARYRMQLKHFVREAQNIARFDKAKDIVNVYDFFEANQTAYIVMELIEGMSLTEYMEECGVMEPRVAVEFIRPLIQAIKKIHSVGIIHRDICPDNIFVMEDTTMKLFDFGSAIFLGEEEPISSCPVKDGYSASELYVAGADSGFFTDVYSVGAVLYHLITGVKPPSAEQRLVNDTLISPRDKGVPVDDFVNGAILEALSLQPELRTPGVTLFEESIMGRRRAFAPEEKVRRRKRRKIRRIGFLAGGALIAAAAVWLVITVLGAGNPMLRGNIDDGTEILVWVEDAETRELIEKITDPGKGEFTNVGEGADDKTREIAEDNKHVSHIEVREVPDMKQSLESVMKEGQKPDLFISDHVNTAELGYAVEPLRETVYEAIDETDYYAFDQETYRSICADGSYIPTRLDMLMYYAYDIIGKGNKTKYKSAFAQGSQTYLDAEQLLSNKTELFAITEPHLTDFSVFVSSDEAGRKQTYQELESRNNEAQKQYQGPGGITGMGVLAGTGERAVLPKFMENDKSKKLTMGQVTIYPVVHDEKVRLNYCKCFSVTADIDESKKLACERLIWTMLGEAAQKNYGAKPDSTLEIPLFKNAVKPFLSYSQLPEAAEDKIKDSKDYQLSGR